MSPKALPTGSDFEKPIQEYTNAFALGWGEDALGKFSIRIAAASYAAAANGVVILKEKGVLLPEQLLDIVKKDNEYDYLPYEQPPQGKKQGSDDAEMYRYDERPKTKICNAGLSKINELKDASYAVLVGRNNSSKSFVLKALTEHWGKEASYLGPARYQNFNLLTHFTPTANKQEEKWRQFSSHRANEIQNLDNSPMNLQQAISELSNDKRLKLQNIIKNLLDVDLEFKLTVNNNDMSQKYVSCNGHNISFTSSGFRLIITIVTCLLDDSYDTIIVDEPELGISPEAQGILADFFFNKRSS